MQMLKWKNCALLGILSWLVINCASMPPNVPACKHLAQRLVENPKTKHLELHPSPACLKTIGEPECGYCVNIVKGEERYIGERGHFLNGKPWSQIKREAILLPAVESYAPLSTHIINQCRRLNCSNDVTRFKVKLDQVLGK